MATVTGFTAARMQQIENNAIASGTVNASGNLILTQNDGGTITAGKVVGPQGATGTAVPTGTAYPASPSNGQMFYRTDLGKLMIYTTATTGWQPPWNTAWGQPSSGFATTTTEAFASSTSTTTATVDAGMSVTFPAIANRIYLITGVLMMASANNSGIAKLLITDSAGVSITQSNYTYSASGNMPMTTRSREIAASTGNITRKLQMKFSPATSAGGTLSSGSSNVGCSFIMVEDIGPNGLPV